MKAQASNWDQRNAGFVPPSRMVQPPTKHLRSQTTQPDTHQRPQNSTKSSSLFSFGIHKTTPSLTSNGPNTNPPNQQSKMQQYPQQQSQQQYQPQQAPPQPPPNQQAPASAQPPPPQPERRDSIGQAAPPPLHPELRSFVSLAFAHVHKIYFSGPMVRKVDRTPDGGKPGAHDAEWVDVWAQLGGTTLSIWEMKSIEAASKEGREVPPSYVNVTDAFVSVLGSITLPSKTGLPPQRYTNVLTLNTAGSNLMLFSCPNSASLVSWASALRLASWEKSRLEEIYTAHLLRMTLSDGGAWKEPRSTLVRGRMEGWAQVRIAGQTDWKRVWVVLSAATNTSTTSLENPQAQMGVKSTGSSTSSTSSMRRISNLFAGGSGSQANQPIIKSSLALYLSQKARDKKKPLLTLYDVSQAFAVYPERPEMISKSTLVKVEGTMGDEEAIGNMKGREAWILLMPELEENNGRMGVMEMLKWIVGLHDTFELYGRPKGYTWDPRDPVSMMFAYPFGPLKDHLFLDRELAEGLDPRDDRTSTIRSRLLHVLVDRMHGPTWDNQPANGRPGPPQLNLGGPPQGPGRSTLTPITERSATNDGHSMAAFDMAGPASTGGATDIPRGIQSLLSNVTTVDQGMQQQPTMAPGMNQQMTNGTGAPSLDLPPSVGQGLDIYPPRRSLDSDSNTPTQVLSNPGMGPAVVQPNPQAPIPAPDITQPTQTMAKAPAPQEGNSLPISSQPQVSTPHPPAENSWTPAPPISTVPSQASAISSDRPSQTAGSMTSPPSSERRMSTSKTDGSEQPAPLHSQQAYPSPAPEPAKRIDQPSPSYSPLPEQRPLPGTNIFTRGQPPTQRTASPWSQAASARVASPLTHSPARQPLRTLSSSPEQILSPTIAERGPPPPAKSVPGTVDITSAKPPADPHKGHENSPAPSSQAAKASETNTQHPYGELSSYHSAQQPSTSSPMAEERALPQVPQAPRRVSDPRRSPLSTHSYPAGAEVQSPDLMEPQPQASRSSHTVLDSPKAEHRAIPHSHMQSPTATSTQSANPVQNIPGYFAMDKPAYSARGNEPLPPVAPLSPRRHFPPTSTGSDEPGRPSFSQGLRTPLGRKPSGARAAPPKRTPIVSRGSFDLGSVQEVPPINPTPPAPLKVTTDLTSEKQLNSAVRAEMDDYGADALAALSFAEGKNQGAYSPPGARRTTPQSSSSPFAAPPPPPPIIGGNNVASGPLYPSSFATSKAAAERKAKNQVQQATSQAAAKKPGHAKGARKKSRGQGVWNDSSEEEEEEEEDDDDDDEGSEHAGPSRGRHDLGSPRGYGQQSPAHGQHQVGPGHLPSPSHSQQDLRRFNGTPPSNRPSPDHISQGQYQRNPRGLPSLPGVGGRSPSGTIPRDGTPPGPRFAGQHNEDGLRPRVQHEEMQPPPRPRSREPPPQLRQTIWSSALNPNGASQGGPPGGRETFVQLEPESETMTKFFTPQGLLQAGLQDKHDRSAKRQEELARESGGALINVPSKPVDPQTGLIGAVTAHERDRKKDGGIGATLTKKLAEERLAEERQRKIDENQRLTLDAMSQPGGSMYDAQGGMPGMMPYQHPMMTGQNPMMSPMGMNPMMMNPMMMNPMMMMGGWGGAAGQQQYQLMAAQAAAMEAYQRAMMSFSQAGSVAPDSGNPSEAGDTPPSAGPRQGSVSPMPGMMPGMMNPWMMGMMGGMGGNPGMMGGNPGMMGGNPGMMSGMGGSPGMMGGNPGMMGGNSGFMSPQAYSPGQMGQDTNGTRLSTLTYSPDYLDTPQSQYGSRQSSEHFPPNGNPARQ